MISFVDDCSSRGMTRLTNDAITRTNIVSKFKISNIFTANARHEDERDTAYNLTLPLSVVGSTANMHG